MTRAATDAGDGEVLLVDGLRKAFASTTAVAGLSLRVGAGEVLGLLGPNGAGKTTTISCISGLLAPDAGRVRICGVDALAHPRETRHRLAVVTQRLAIYPGLDVATNLHFYCALAGLSGATMARSIADAVEAFALGGILSRRVMNLSDGQQRLVHVATAFVSLASRPGLLVLDEATAGLDVTARALVLDAVRALAAKGVGILYSSHYLPEVEELCKRVAILHRGQLIADGAVADLVKAHGGGHVELQLDDGVVVRQGDDLGAALATVPSLDRIRSARVVRPSLETVFVSLTGQAIEAANGGSP